MRDPAGIAMAPFDKQKPTPHIQRTAMIEQFAGSQQQWFPRPAAGEFSSQSGPGTSAGTGGWIFGVSNRPATYVRGHEAQLNVCDQDTHMAPRLIARAARPKEAVANGKSRLDSALTLRPVTVLAQQPTRIG